MPALTTVIDDKSPLISYDSTWLPGSSWDDSLADNYYLGTFTTNNVTGGVVQFSFNGTAISIYGAERTNHGSYTVQVDSATYTGNGDGNNTFQQSLYSTSSLTQDTHTLTLTNTATGSLYVDIDMIAWQSQVGDPDDELVTEIVQDTDSGFQYQNPGWVTVSSTTNVNLNLFNNGSGHLTSTYNASVTFTFTVGFYSFQYVISAYVPYRACLPLTLRYAFLTGLSAEAVSLFGISGPSNGPYTVQLDGGKTTIYNATNAYPTNYGILIFHADNLGSGSHQIVLTNLPASNEQILAIDHAQLWTVNSAGAVTNNTSPIPNSGNSASTTLQNDLSSGAIAGIAVAATVAVLGAGVAIFFYRRWKAALDTHRNLYRIYSSRQPPPESTIVAPTGVSSSLETRPNANFNPSSAFSGRTEQQVNDPEMQYNGVGQVAFGSRDSGSLIDTSSSPTQSPVDEGMGRRPLPDAPGGGMSLATEFPKLAGVRRGQSVLTADRSSIAISDVPPPNYTQATRNAATVDE